MSRLLRNRRQSTSLSNLIKSDPQALLDLPGLLGIQDQPDLLELTQRFQVLWDRLAPMELIQLFQVLLAHKAIPDPLDPLDHRDPLDLQELIQLFQGLLDLLDPKETPAPLVPTVLKARKDHKALKVLRVTPGM